MGVLNYISLHNLVTFQYMCMVAHLSIYVCSMCLSVASSLEPGATKLNLNQYIILTKAADKVLGQYVYHSQPFYLISEATLPEDLSFNYLCH